MIAGIEDLLGTIVCEERLVLLHVRGRWSFTVKLRWRLTLREEREALKYETFNTDKRFTSPQPSFISISWLFWVWRMFVCDTHSNITNKHKTIRKYKISKECRWRMFQLITLYVYIFFFTSFCLTGIFLWHLVQYTLQLISSPNQTIPPYQVVLPGVIHINVFSVS